MDKNYIILLFFLFLISVRNHASKNRVGIFKMLKEKKANNIRFYLVKLSFKNEGEIMTQQKLEKFAWKTALQEMLK